MDSSQDKSESGPSNLPTQVNNNCKENPMLVNVGTKPISPTPTALDTDSSSNMDSPSGQDEIESGPVNLPTQADNNRKESATNVGTKPISPMPIALDAESQRILKDTLETLKPSTIAQEVGEDTRSRFWATYRREAKEYDESFLERYKDDMDIVLIFAGLFSAVSTTFITSMQSSLNQDPTATTHTLLMQIVHANNASAFAGHNLELPIWNGPGPTIIWTQSLIFASLAASLLAALGAVLGKQWLANYRQPIFGTSEERALSRQRKLDALNDWHFQAMLGVLPVLLQISLLLFGTALSAHVWTQQIIVGAIVMGATAVGILFYASITVSSLVSINCPFQTPLASTVRIIQHILAQGLLHLRKAITAVYIHRHRDILLRFPAFKPIFHATKVEKVPLAIRHIIFLPIFSVLVSYLYVKEFTKHCIPAIQKSMSQIISKYTWRNTPSLDDSGIQPPPISSNHWISLYFGDPEIRPTSTSSEPSTICLNLPSRPLHEHEALAVRWLLESSTDQEVLLIAAQLVPDIEWPAEVDVSAACAQLKNAFTGCFESAPGNHYNLALTPFGEKRAYFFGKALLHLSCIRQHFTNAERGHLDSLVDYYNCLDSRKDVNPSCLSAIAYAMTWRFISSVHEDSLTSLDRRWLLHIFPPMLAYLASDVSLRYLVVREVAKWLNSLSSSRQVLADCFLSAAMVLGAPIDRKDWVKVDKSSAAEKLLGVLLRQIASVSDINADVFSPLFLRDGAADLLSPLSALLERGEIYPRFGTCGSGECSCDIVDRIVGITKSYALKAIEPDQQNEPDQRAEILKHAREALHIGAVLSATTPGDHPTRARWKPTYRGHPVPFSIDMDGSGWVHDFLDHHYGVCDDVAIADMFFMLSQSRGIEDWADLSWFVDALARAMQHNAIHVRHSALRVTFRMRHSLASLPDIQTLLPGLYAAVSTNDDTAYPSDKITMLYLRILYTFTLHHDHIWATNLFQIKISEQCCKLALADSQALSSPSSLFLIAIMDILEHRNTRCNFRNSIDQELAIKILSRAWLAVGLNLSQSRSHSLHLDPRIDSDILDEVLPHLVAFTFRYQKTDSTAMARIKFLPNLMGVVLHHLQRTAPESPAVRLIQEMISDSTANSLLPKRIMIDQGSSTFASAEH